MQKQQQISVLLLALVGFGTGILLAHLEQGDSRAFKADVLVSTDAPVSPAAPVGTDTPVSTDAPVATPPAPITDGTSTTSSPPSETVSVPLPSGAVTDPLLVSSDSGSSGVAISADPKSPDDKEKNSTSSPGTGLILGAKTTSSLAETPDAKDASESLSPEISSPDMTIVEVKAVDEAIDPKAPDVKPPDIAKTSDVVKPPDVEPSAAKSPDITSDVVQPPTQPIPPVPNETSTRHEEARIAIEEAKKQPRLNKQILDAIGALRNIPDLLAQFAIVKNDNGKKDKGDTKENTPKSLLEIITDVIKELTDNLQKNTVALEETLDYIYKQQGTVISHGRCISASYFTYSDAENTCLMISRKVCKTSDIVPDNRYETMESCQQDHNLIRTQDSREMSEFKKQKTQYLGRLASLQQAYKYYSVRWEELVDLVKDSQSFESMGAAGNAINLYRTENQEAEAIQQKVPVQEDVKVEKKPTVPTTLPQGDTPLSPLPAASVQ